MTEQDFDSDDDDDMDTMGNEVSLEADDVLYSYDVSMKFSRDDYDV
jgi:hypothetical protein